MAMAATAARPTTPPTTMPAIAAVWSDEGNVGPCAGTFVEAVDNGAEEVMD